MNQCQAIKRNGKPCRQKGDNVVDCYCQYHHKFRVKSKPPVVEPPVVEPPVVKPPVIEKKQLPFLKELESWEDNSDKSHYRKRIENNPTYVPKSSYLHFRWMDKEWLKMPRGYSGGLKEYLRFMAKLKMGAYETIKYRAPVKMDVINRYVNVC
jgi:hypothetical protein